MSRTPSSTMMKRRNTSQESLLICFSRSRNKTKHCAPETLIRSHWISKWKPLVTGWAIIMVWEIASITKTTLEFMKRHLLTWSTLERSKFRVTKCRSIMEVWAIVATFKSEKTHFKSLITPTFETIRPLNLAKWVHKTRCACTILLIPKMIYKTKSPWPLIVKSQSRKGRAIKIIIPKIICSRCSTMKMV